MHRDDADADEDSADDEVARTRRLTADDIEGEPGRDDGWDDRGDDDTDMVGYVGL